MWTETQREPERDEVHEFLGCVQGDPEVLSLLQQDAAVQAGRAPQL